MLNYADSIDIQDEVEVVEEENKHLVFNIGNESYGIHVNNARQIISSQDKITPIPQLPNYMTGIMNLRGSVIPVMDVRIRFNSKEIIDSGKTCIIIVDYQDMVIGIKVDSVQEVRGIESDKIVLPPKTTRIESHKYINGLYQTPEGIILLLDCDLLFQY